jgi:hypothetical protein
LLTWQLQTQTQSCKTWVCKVGYVHEAHRRVTWGFWGKGYPRDAPSVEAAKQAIYDAYEPEYIELLEKAITGEWGDCIKCGENALGTPQGSGEVLCLKCQNKYQRELKLR